jgi:acyl-CoA synthetase (NDP forming)
VIVVKAGRHSQGAKAAATHAGALAGAGVSVAEVNLKLVWDVVTS